jgi:hypothetical protein
MKNTLPQNANHPVSSRPAFIEKPKHTIKKTFPEMPPFWICSVRRISCPQVGKRKNLSRYHLEEKEKQDRVFARSLKFN